MKLSGKEVKGRPEFYVDGTKIENVEMHTFNLTVAGGGGIASHFLTSDGLTKGAGNTFLFTTVYPGGGIVKSIQTIAEAGACHGFDYNATTGLARWLFLESNGGGILIGGSYEGLEAEENGIAVACWLNAIR